MIARYDKNFNGQKVIYYFVECNSIEDIVKKYKNKPRIEYVGEIIRDAQVTALERYGNTVIPKTMLKELGEGTIKTEIKRITGYDVIIYETKHGTVILERR